MKVFISWSKDLSHEIAESFKDWLENVLQPVNIFISSETDKGAVWFGKILQELKSADFCIVCLTKENNNSSWINFEAGAIASNISKNYVSAILVDLEPSEVRGPLSQFQHTRMQKKDIKGLVKTINKNLEEDLRLTEARLDTVFEKWWNDLENNSKQIIDSQAKKKEEESQKTERELLEDLIEQNKSYFHMWHDIYNSSRKLLQNSMNDFYIPKNFEDFFDSVSNRREELIRLYFGVDRDFALTEHEIAVRFDMDVEEVRELILETLKKFQQYKETAT